MKRTKVYLIALLVVSALVTAFFIMSGRRASQPIPAALAQDEQGALVAAPGRVEPVSEEIEVRSDIGGILKAVTVEEGDRVRAGQVIAILKNDDYRAQVASAEARVREREAQLRRVINGARSQERLEAWQGVKEAEAMMENARIEMERRQSLVQRGVIAREESDRAEREYKVAKSRYDGAVQRHALIDDEAREEDRSKAEADVALARAELDEARARLEKSIIRSPINGVILRKHLNRGESVSEMRDTPIVTVADVSTLRVRVDVDETDIGKVQINQRAYVTADAYPNQKFWGRVVRVGQVLGKKKIRTDEPTERVDTKILETLIQLDDGNRIPPGLRVDAFIVVAQSR